MEDNTYRYREVSLQLVQDLLLHVDRGESFVLLGFQGCGKRHAIRLLGEELDKRNHPHLSISFPDNRYLVTAPDILARMKDKLKAYNLPGIKEKLAVAPTIEEWFAILRREAGSTRIPLSITNLESVGDEVKLFMLQKIQDAVEAKKLIIGLSGEADLARVLGKDTSPFRCTYGYVLSGHDRQLARRFFQRRIEAWRFNFPPNCNEEVAFESLYQLTGGNLNLMRVVLISLLERSLRIDEADDLPLPAFDPGRLATSIREYSAIPLFGFKVFEQVVTLAELHESVFKRLVEMLNLIDSRDIAANWTKARVSLWTPNSGSSQSPEGLELAGLLKRDPVTGTIGFASYYAAEFAVHHFSIRAQGDFHARHGNWDEAFKCWRQIEAAILRRRPSTALDFKTVRSIVNRLCREFAEIISRSEPTLHLLRLIQDVAQWLFGLSAAYVLRMDEHGLWQRVDLNGNPKPAADLHDIVTRVAHESEVRLRKKRDRDVAIRVCKDKRMLLAEMRPNRFELKPRHALLFISASEGALLDSDGFRYRLLDTVAANFMTCFHDARLRKRVGGLRRRFGQLARTLNAAQNVRDSVIAVYEYLKSEFEATGVRLFFINPDNRDQLVSSQSWGFADEKRRVAFESGELRLHRENDAPLWKAVTNRNTYAYRWVPQGQVFIASSDLEFEVIADHPKAWMVEREPGDYWIDFPLYVKDQPHGKLTLAFRSHSPPGQRHLADLEEVSELLNAHLERLQVDEVRLAQMRGVQAAAVASTAHDLVGHFASLAILRFEYRELAKQTTGQVRIKFDEITTWFEKRFGDTLATLENAKLKLAEVKPEPITCDLRPVITNCLRAIDRSRGEGVLKADEGALVVFADPKYLTTIFTELISDSQTMFSGCKRPRLRIQIGVEVDLRANQVRIVYEDNGPGIDPRYKEKIFDRHFTQRPPGSRKSLGLGLAQAREIVEAHNGKIFENGAFGEGVQFIFTLPHFPSPP